MFRNVECFHFAFVFMHDIRAETLLNIVHLIYIPECILATFLHKDFDQVVLEDFVGPSSPADPQVC